MIEYLREVPSPKEYNSLRKEVGWSECEEAGVELGLLNTLFCIVAKENDSILGMGRVIGDGVLVFYIQDVIVVPSHQKKGIGKELMKNILEFIESRSINNSTIGLMAAIGKEDFYKGFGFVQRPNLTMGPGMTVFVKKSTNDRL